MTRILIEIPRVGLVMETARVLRWLKDIGDTVVSGEPLLEVETEKTTVEIEASSTGKLVEILAVPEQEVAIGAAIAWLEDGQAEALPATPAAVTTAEAAPEAAPAPASRESIAADGNRQRSSPAARRLAANHGIELSSIRGTGPGGRIQLEDVEALAAQAQGAAAAAPEAVPLSPMRRAVARAMTLSNATVPQFTVSRSVDWTEVLSLQSSLAADSPPGAARLSINDFLLQALALTLVAFPSMNGVFAGHPDAPDARIVPAAGANIGLVVAVAGGMLVPVLSGVESLGLRELACRRSDLVARARDGRLRQEDASGATFSISNMGTGGPDRFTAMLNPPESGILAVGRMRDMPVARDRSVVVRPCSDLTLTLDHRVADGKLGSDFLARLTNILEQHEWLI